MKTDRDRVADLERKVVELTRRMHAVERERYSLTGSILRLAVTAVDPETIDEEAPDGVYPSEGNTVFIKFVDAIFTEEEGDQSVTKRERTEEALAVARTLSGGLPAEETLVVVVRIGNRWWIIDAGAATVIVKGRLNASLTSTGTGIIEQIVIGTPPEEVDDEINLTNANTQFAGSTDWKFCAVRTADGTYELLWVACPEEE